MSPRRRTRLKDVADLAQTSAATVSRVLNNQDYVSAELRTRVLEAVEALHYHPNLRAKGLRQQSGFGIGLIVPSLLNAYYTAFADSASQLIAERGYHLMLCSTRDDPHTEQSIFYDMIGQDVAGLIWVPTAPSSRMLEYLDSQRIPAVTIVRRLPRDPVDTVVFEDFNGGYAATQHLIELGHRLIGYVGGDVEHSSNHARWQGYLAAVRDAGVSVDDRMVCLGTLTSSYGEEATEHLLRLPSPPTAIFAASNAVMPGVIKGLRHRGIALPDEMSIICFDDVDWFSFSVPSITAIRIRHADLAETATGLLLERIDRPDSASEGPVFIEINFELAVRNSTAPPRKVPLLLRGDSATDGRVHAEG